MNTQILTGAKRRAAKRNMEVSAFTRAEAREKIASTKKKNVLENFVNHRNSHVQKAAQYKLELLARKRSEAAKKAAETRRKKQQKAA